MNTQAIATIMPLIKQGLLPKEIARQTGFPYHFCSYHRRLNGKKLKRGRPKGIVGPSFDTVLKIKAASNLRKHGWTLQKIANEFNLTRQRIHQLLKAA